ncbi:hypothetical protein [Paracoccus sp. PAMC 22219]|uniref:hypothetical protein n=1 Tax=Paracoccus sp. PAMC 22219 TaxID=1569209 RepID=UPI0005A7BAA3|nr:hypothetical protein [Paracoccus sp. PAMC 22219]
MPYINDLIELSGIASNTTYTTTNGSIIGVVDGATYTGDDDNTATAVTELNNTDADGGIRFCRKLCVETQGVDDCLDFRRQSDRTAEMGEALV